MNTHEHPQSSGGWFQSKKTTWVLLGFIAIGVLSVHGTYSPCSGAAPLCAVSLVSTDDALHDAWRAWRLAI